MRATCAAVVADGRRRFLVLGPPGAGVPSLKHLCTARERLASGKTLAKKALLGNALYPSHCTKKSGGSRLLSSAVRGLPCRLPLPYHHGPAARRAEAECDP